MRLRRDLAVPLLLLCACAHPAPTQTNVSGAASGGDTSANGPAMAEAKPTKWGRALDAWTHTEKVYKDFETRLIVTATYRSEALRDSYVEEYARRYRLSEEEKEKMARREHDAGTTYQEFFIAAYTGNSRENDFNRRNSIWKLRLKDDKGNFVDPLTITRQKDDDPVAHSFYPYFSEWSRAYLVKFPRAGLADDSKTITLTLSSATADATLVYDRTHADTSAPGVHVELETAVSAASPVPSAIPAPDPTPSP